MGCNKDKVAEELIDWHFRVDPETEVVYRILSPNEESAEEPIKLLEVSEATPDTGHVDAFVFGPTTDTPYSTMVAIVSGCEMELIENGRISLPDGWDLALSKKHLRPRKRYARK
jgi:hypothetical protein